MAERPYRRSLEETWAYLEAEGEQMPRDAQGEPFVPARMPGYDDEEPLGFSYFRAGVEDTDNHNLTLPRTFFGRSELVRVDFSNTDLSESRMCWNDFVECDFTGAVLAGCDMRASNFRLCSFRGADLTRTDLRGSTFEGCDFTDTVLTGARIHRLQDLCRQLTDGQKRDADLVWRPSPLPGGG